MRGREREAEVVGIDLTGIGEEVHEGTHTEAAALAQDAQAVGDERAVFADEGGDVGDRADGNQIEEVLQEAARGVGILCAAAQEGMGELEGQARAAEFIEGVGAIGLFGVDDGEGARGRAVGLVVIGDDDVHAEALASSTASCAVMPLSTVMSRRTPRSASTRTDSGRRP
jgi:hypothetical protein